jgi:hypothetical protein
LVFIFYIIKLNKLSQGIENVDDNSSIKNTGAK